MIITTSKGGQLYREKAFSNRYFEKAFLIVSANEFADTSKLLKIDNHRMIFITHHSQLITNKNER